MQAPRMDLVDAHLKGELAATLADGFGDPQVRTEIVLRSQTGKSVDLEAGTVVRQASEDQIGALARTVDEREAADAEGALQVGDRVYLVDQADVTDLQKVDRIVDGSNVLEVVSWQSDPLGLVHQIVGRAVR